MIATNVRVQTPPAEEPVSLSEAKAHMRIVVNDDDALISRLIATARRQCERISRRAFVARTLEAILDDWPYDGTIALPYPPLASVTSIKYMDVAGSLQTIDAADYIVDAHSQPGRIMLVHGRHWHSLTLQPLAAIAVRYVAGYGPASAVPDDYKSAILLYVAHLYENREAVVVQQGITAMQIPMAVEALLMSDRGSW